MEKKHIIRFGRDVLKITIGTAAGVLGATWVTTKIANAQAKKEMAKAKAKAEKAKKEAEKKAKKDAADEKAAKEVAKK